MKKYILIALLSITFSASILANEDIKTWVGISQKEMIETWGYPTNRNHYFKVNSSIKVFTYETTAGIEPYETCKTTFALNHVKKIVWAKQSFTVKEHCPKYSYNKPIKLK